MKKVENFRLTKEHLSWYKEVKKVNAVKSLLAKGALAKWFQEGQQLKKIFGQLEQQKKQLNTIAPEEKMNEIPGQEAEQLNGSPEDINLLQDPESENLNSSV